MTGRHTEPPARCSTCGGTGQTRDDIEHDPAPHAAVAKHNEEAAAIGKAMLSVYGDIPSAKTAERLQQSLEATRRGEYTEHELIELEDEK